jgi:hypothetical protein
MKGRTLRIDKQRGRRGAIVLLAAGMMFVLIAFVGLAFDVGYMQWCRRRAQTAADAAAIAGAWAVQMGESVTTEGKNGSSVNGFTDAQNGVTVTINNPPSSGSYSGSSGAVEAIVSQDAPSYFMRILGFNTLPVRARAVAGEGYGTGCVYALDPSAHPALDFSGGAQVSLGCGAIVESSGSPATRVTGTSSVTMSNSASIGSVGPYTVNNGSTVTPANSLSSGIVSPGDPLATTLDMPNPDSSAYCFNGTTMVNDVSCAALSNLAGGTYQPGVYCGGITVNSGATVILNAGLYILAGGAGLKIEGGTVTAEGVSFYVTDTAGWPCTGLNGSNAHPSTVSINSQAVVTLKAPNDGDYAGIAIFVNRDLTGNDAPKPNNINGGAGFTLSGVLYFPNSPLNFSGSSDSTGYMMIIAQTVNFTGTTSLTLNNFPPEFANNNPAFKKWVTLRE